MPSRIDIRIDITDAVPLDTHLETAAWIYIPDADIQPDYTIVTFAFPGGTYSRSYYDLSVPGRTGYSFAERLAEAGYIVIACDHIGIGDSSPYEPFSALTKDVVISADCATVEDVMTRLTAGTLVDGLAPVMNPFTIGVGHSMGGYLLARQQARYHSFDAVAILGWSALARPENEVLSPAEWSSYMSMMPDPTRPPRALFRDFFYDKRVPDDVKAADDALAVRIYSWMFQPDKYGLQDDPTIPEATRRIDVPIFLCFGERDTSPNPHHESDSYPNSADLTTFVLPRSAHCTNFAETRILFFDRLANWGHALSNTYRQATGSLPAPPDEVRRTMRDTTQARREDCY